MVFFLLFILFTVHGLLEDVHPCILITVFIYLPDVSMVENSRQKIKGSCKRRVLLRSVMSRSTSKVLWGQRPILCTAAGKWSGPKEITTLQIIDVTFRDKTCHQMPVKVLGQFDTLSLSVLEFDNEKWCSQSVLLMSSKKSHV